MRFPQREFKCSWFLKMKWWETVFSVSPWDYPFLALPKLPKSNASFLYLTIWNMMYLFRRAEVTKCHKLGGFTPQEFIRSQSWRLKVQTSRCWQGYVLSEGSRGGLFLASSSFWQLPEIHGDPCLVKASLQCPPPSSHGHLPCVVLLLWRSPVMLD